MFWTLHLVDCLSPFCLFLFLEFYSVLLFGTCYFVSSFWQLPCVCFYILGKTANPSVLVEWPYVSRYPIGPSSTLSLVTCTGCSRCVPCVDCVHPPDVIKLWLLLAWQWVRLTCCGDWHDYNRQVVVWGLTPQSWTSSSGALVPTESILLMYNLWS